MQMKIKLLSIMINIIIHRLIILHQNKTEVFIDNIIADDLHPLHHVSDEDPEEVRVGLPLVLSLWQIFKHEIEASVDYRPLANTLFEEQRRILAACVRSKKGKLSSHSVLVLLL
jgi:hypothetical protein